jgi:hypothetical protein
MNNKIYEKMFDILSHKKNANLTTLRFHFTPNWKSTTTAGEDAGKMVPLYTAGGNVN